ncbi:MAG: dihydrodipicolinate synthase family protein [Rhodospirillaceae bacterium]|nr:dihydrodipicolinate synthase family protein [Rhodospirillaceae bacterium]
MLELPTYSGQVEFYKLQGKPLLPRAPSTEFNRMAFAAVHVVSSPLLEKDPWQGRPAIDWDETLKFRHYLWDQGLHVAEAMDTAQRGMGLDWVTAKDLIRRTVIESRSHPLKPKVVCGAGTDQFLPEQLRTEDEIIRAYSEQMEAIEKVGGKCVVMASRAMLTIGEKPDRYTKVYGKLIEQAAEPVILHWLGDMFDPKLKGYWGCKSLDEAEEVVLALIESHADKIDGIKISLLEKNREERFRNRLNQSIRLYTGDDFNYATLIDGDRQRYSDALLGIFSAIAPAASQALEALARGDSVKFHDILRPTVALSREIFKSPTQYYKAGIAFLAWLNGVQKHFVMVGGLQSSREINHYAEVFRLADRANLLVDPDLAISRMRSLLALHGL